MSNTEPTRQELAHSFGLSIGKMHALVRQRAPFGAPVQFPTSSHEEALREFAQNDAREYIELLAAAKRGYAEGLVSALDI